VAGNRLPLKAQLEAASASNRASHARIRLGGGSITPFDPDLLPATHAPSAVPIRRLTPLPPTHEPWAVPVRSLKPLNKGNGTWQPRYATGRRTQRSARRNWWEDRPIGSYRLRTSPESLRSAPGSSLGGLTTIEPGSRDRPEDRSPVRSGGSHLPLRARRNVPAAVVGPQPPYPRTSEESLPAYPRLSPRCGWHVDEQGCNIRATSGRRRFP
jgi:hypothetical protein